MLLILSLVALRYVDDASLSARARGFVRHALISLAYAGAALLAAGVIVLGIGLVRRPSGGAERSVGQAFRPARATRGGRSTD